MSKQTAVEWLIEQINPDMKTMQGNIIQDLLERAKAMEREQMGLPNCGPMDPNIKSVTIVDLRTGKTYKGGEQ